MRALFLLSAGKFGILTYAWHVTPIEPDSAQPAAECRAARTRRGPLVLPRPKRACLEWGPFGASEQKTAQSALKRSSWVSSQLPRCAGRSGLGIHPPLKNKAEVERKIAELERLGEGLLRSRGAGPDENATLGFSEPEERYGISRDCSRSGVRSARGAGKPRAPGDADRSSVREPDIAATSPGELRLQFPGRR